MSGLLRAPVFYLTGRYRLSPRGEQVVLQLQEETRPMDRPQSRWRDATPQEVMPMIEAPMMSSVLRSNASPSDAPRNPPSVGSSGSKK